MKAALLTILLGCFCGPNAAAEVPAKEDVDIQWLAGKWYPVWTAKLDPGEIPIHAYAIEPLLNGDVTLKVELPQDGSCKLVNSVLTRIRPGVFSTPDGLGTVTLLDTDYDTYHFSHYAKGDILQVYLYAKEKEVSDDVKQKFVTFVKLLDLNPEQLFPLREADLCTSPPE